MSNVSAFRTASVVLTLLAGSSYSVACSCTRIAPACEAAWKADAVFVGKVESFDPFTIFGIPLTWPWLYPMRHVRFAVSEHFVGGKQNTIEITTGMGGGDCGIPFQ
jgi:hypothetical protein